MSSNDISVGDWVIVVRCTHACWQEVYGVPFLVSCIVDDRGHSGRCKMCKASMPGMYAGGYGGWLIPISWLKKLNDPAQSERIERDEVTHA